MQENHNLVYSFYRTNGCVIKARARSTRQTLISKNLNSSVLPLEVKIPSDEGVNIWILFDLKRERERKKKKTVKTLKQFKRIIIRPFQSFLEPLFRGKLSAKPSIWIWFFILTQIKLIFTTNDLHLASL